MLLPDLGHIGEHLQSLAKRDPRQTALIVITGRDASGTLQHQSYRFMELFYDVERMARGLVAAGFGKGARTLVMLKPGLDFFATTFALLKIGAVPVLIDPGMGIKNLKPCIADAEPQALLGTPKAQLARLVFGWGGSALQQIVTAGSGWWWGGTTLKKVREQGAMSNIQVEANVAPDDAAAILFTSGSTGIAKGALYTHEIFSAQIRLLRKMYDIQPGEVDVATFPLFALFGPVLGMTTIIPQMDMTRPGFVDPMNIIDPIREFKATNMFGSPALIQRVGEYGAARDVSLPTLRRVISAGAPARTESLAAFSKMLEPDAQIHTPYGATEALPVASIGSHEILKDTAARTAEGAGVCVGRPVDEADVRIIRITDEPIKEWSDDFCLPTGEIGEVAVKGPMVTRAYVNRPEQTRLAKIKIPGASGIWHRMGDVGYFDEQGRLWICGRKSHRVQLTDDCLYTIPVERIFNAHPQVFRSALVGVERNGARHPVLCVELSQNGRAIDKRKLAGELRKLATERDDTARIEAFLFHPGFPVDVRHNSKIFREKLAAWAEKEWR